MVPAARRDSPIRSLEKVSRHAPVIWSALETPRSIVSLRKTTVLSYRQVQWAVQRLLDEGFIEMVGGQGRRATSTGASVLSRMTCHGPVSPFEVW